MNALVGSFATSKRWKKASQRTMFLGFADGMTGPSWYASKVGFRNDA